MFELDSPWLAFQGFFDAGGSVLWAIFFATMLMWTMIVERLWFLRTHHSGNVERAQAEWSGRTELDSWASRSIRRQLISGVSQELRRYVRLIQALMALLPLLGLLGTVTGMIQVFNVMAFAGTTNPRLMAAGVSAATIPTMSGLVAALSGLWFAVYYSRKSRAEMRRIEELLSRDGVR
jgi:biopolymer transport protein ExbB